MTRAFTEIAFTKGVRERQSELGSRESYAALDDETADRGDRLTEAEAQFIRARDELLSGDSF